MPIKVVLSIIWRSLFIQAAWNFKGMQNIGFTHAIIPGLKHLSQENHPENTNHTVSFFNTQPYMASTAIGVFLHLQENGNEEMIEKIRPSLTGSLAAIGDTFFWTVMKPVLAILLLFSAVFDQMWGLFMALILYNTLHLWTVAWGFSMGYRKGPQGALTMGRLLSVDLSNNVSLLIPFLSGILLFYIPHKFGPDQSLITVILLFVVSTVLLKLRVNIFWLVYGVFTLTVLWTILL